MLVLADRHDPPQYDQRYPLTVHALEHQNIQPQIGYAFGPLCSVKLMQL
jgi:hypothetical protein